MLKVSPEIIAIAAVARDNVIGSNNSIPWHYKEDMKFFKETTTGHTIIMGRKTFDSIGRALPGRRNIVLTRNESWMPPKNVEAVYSLDQALYCCELALDKRVFICGGEAIYELAMPHITHMIITHIDRDFDGDVRFPPWYKSGWKETKSTKSGELTFSYYERVV